MSIYHCSIKTLSRKKSRSTVQKSSYICCTRAADLRTGKVYNYENKLSELVFTETSLPKNAPEEWKDPKKLWNAVEEAEKRQDAKLAYDVVASLPRELTREEQLEVCREQVDFLTEKGFCVTWAVHDKEDGNPHCHMLLTLRPVNSKGEFAEKEKKEFVLDDHGERIPLIDPKTGEQKIRKRKRIADNGKEYCSEEKLWKTRKVQYNPLDGRELYKEIRQHWADRCNERLPEDEKISPLSYEEQGKALTPSVTYTPAAKAIDERGQYSPIMEKHRDVEIKRLSEKIEESIKKQFDKMLKLKEKIQTKLDELKLKVDKYLEAQKPKYPEYYPSFYIKVLEECKAEQEQAREYEIHFTEYSEQVVSMKNQIERLEKSMKEKDENFEKADIKIRVTEDQIEKQKQLIPLYEQYEEKRKTAREKEKLQELEEKKIFKSKKKIEEATINANVARNEAETVMYKMRKLIPRAYSDYEALQRIKEILKEDYEPQLKEAKRKSDEIAISWGEDRDKKEELEKKLEDPERKVELALAYRPLNRETEDEKLEEMAETLRWSESGVLRPFDSDIDRSMVKAIARFEITQKQPLNTILESVKIKAQEQHREEVERQEEEQSYGWGYGGMHM